MPSGIPGSTIAMRVKVEQKKGKSEVAIKSESTVEDLMRKLQLHVDAHIAIISGHPVPLTHVLQEGDEIRIVKVASGG